MPMKSSIEVIVTLNETHMTKLAGIQKKLAAKGLSDIHALPNIGAITGKCEPDLLKELRSVSGVAAVEISGEVKLAPPESDIQ